MSTQQEKRISALEQKIADLENRRTGPQDAAVAPSPRRVSFFTQNPRPAHHARSAQSYVPKLPQIEPIKTSF